MASLSQTPDTLNPMNRGGKWILNQTPTSPPVETRAAWEVEVEGTKISEGSELTVSGSDNIIIDPRNDITGFLRLGIPGFTSQSVYNITDQVIAEVSLNYGTVEIDASTEPVTKTVNVGSSSGPFDFINAMISPHHGDILGDTTARFLSDMPDKVFTHPFAYGWISLYGNSAINGFYRTCDGVTDTFNMSAPFDVNAIPCGPQNLGLPENTEYYTLEFVAMSRTIAFHVECGVRAHEAGNIAFLEPIGGLSNHAFTSVSQGGAINSQTSELHYEPDSDFDDWSNGGMSVLKRSAQPAFSMAIRIKPSPQYYHFVNGMMGSPIAWIQMQDTSGSVIFVKAMITGAQIGPTAPDGHATLAVSAAMLKEIKGQRSVW